MMLSEKGVWFLPDSFFFAAVFFDSSIEKNMA